MKATGGVPWGGLVLAVSLLFIHAQEVSSTDSTDSMSDTEVMLQAIAESATPVPASSVPEPSSPFSGYYSFQNPDWPPLPGNELGFNVWILDRGMFLLDDRSFDYSSLGELFQLAAELDQESARNSAMNLSLAYNPAEDSLPILTNLVAGLAEDQTMTMSFDIAGAGLFVPWDIVSSTNLVGAPEEWNWLGVGYTSNRYTFTNQPQDLAFYRLAQPSQTMTVGWGNTFAGEGEVPYGLTNAIQVAGGFAHSLALLTDRTVAAWGNDDYGQSDVPTNATGVAMVAAGWYHSVAVLTNGTVLVWGYHGFPFGEAIDDVPLDLTNATVVSAQGNFTLALRDDGTVSAWGHGEFGETNVPSGLTNVTARNCGGLSALPCSERGWHRGRMG